MTPEGKIQARLKKQVEASGGSFRKLAWVGRRGAPDCLIWWGKNAFFVECKRPGQRATSQQVREHARLPLPVFVIDSAEEVDDFVQFCSEGWEVSN